MKVFFRFTWCILLFGLAVFPTQAAFTSIYIFGDGVSTTTSNTSFAGPLYYGNRYSNGRVWVEVLAQQQGLGANSITNVNWSYSSNNWSYDGDYSSDLVQNVGNFNAPTNATNALFVVWVNDADFVYDVVNYGTSLTQWTNAINLSLTNHYKAITNLYAKGVRTLIMPNAVDIGKVPVYQNYAAAKNGFLRQRVIYFNTAFTATLNQARTNCPGLKIYEPDFFTLLNNVLTNAAAYGLTNAGIDALDDLSLTNLSLTGPGANYIWWDDMDPTAKVHEIMADTAQQLISPVIITSQPTNQAVVVGGTASFSVTASGTPPLRYQWNFNGTNISGATNTTLVFTNVQFSQAGTYTVLVTNLLVTNLFGSVLSSNAVLTVNGIPPFITTQPTNRAVVVGGTATFSVTAGGTPSPWYQWNLNGTNISGATNTTLVFTNVQFSQAGTYTVLVTNAYGSVLSSNAVLTVNGIPPFITTQPTNRTVVVVGGTATFSVTAGGTPSPWYQWNLNGTNISGATNTTLVLTNVQFSQAGTYTVLVTNAYGSVLSSNAVLTVNGIPPFITTQPTNQPVVVGGTATFSVTAGGTPSLSYRWYFNGTNLLAGATNTLLTLTNVQTTNTGNYSVVVTNVAGSVTSSNATLTVVPLLITTQPTNQAVAPGGTATFTVAVSGTGPFTYQWQLNGTNLPNNIITTVAGNGTGGYSGDNNAATTASLYYPTAVAVDSSGNLFIADDSNTLIRKVGTNGIITTVAGGGTNYPGNGGQATDAQLNDPVGVAVDASGNLFISDRLNYQRVYKVDTKGIMTTVAGSGTNYPGDGGQATNASLSQIEGVAVDASGNLYIADFNNNRIRKVDTTGIITTVAGNGIDGYSGDNGPATHAEMRSPIGVAVDASGNLFIADWENYCIRKVNTNGIITTVAGGGNAGYSGDNGPATHAQLDMASGVAVDAYGNLFIADLYNSRIREVTPNGIITTVAGNGNFGYSGDNGAATNATLNAPYGVAVDASGNLLIADFLNSRIRKVGLAGYPTLTLNNVTAANAGNYTVVITSPYGSVTSAPPARLTVTMQSGSAGQTANISVSSLGSSSSISGGKNVSFNITGSPGTSCDVYSSSDLKHWTFVGEVTMNASGIASFTVSVTSGMPQQFYRLVSAGQ